MQAPFSLVISAQSAEELKSKVLEAANSIGGNTATAQAVKEAPKSAEKDAPKGRKPKAEKDTNPFEEAAPVPAKANPFDDEDAPAPQKQLTLEDVKAQLQKVADQKGMEKAQEIVGQLKVTKVKEIKPEQFAEALALCEKALK